MTNEQLRRKCIEKDWFTRGSISQYNKLFDLNSVGVDTEKLAIYIWLCSDDCWSINEIINELEGK